MGVRSLLPGHDVAAIAIHDDWYFEMAATSLANFWPVLRDGMGARNHKMSAEKCQVLILAPPGSRQHLEAVAAAEAAGLPVAAGHVDALGTALGGLRELTLETDGRPSTASLKFLDKRVAQLETDARLCKELLEFSSDPKAAQVAWALLEGATSKALDYDLAVLPPRLTTAARARANLALRGSHGSLRGMPSQRR